jgi:hypothetical protein
MKDSTLRLWRCYHCGNFVAYNEWCYCANAERRRTANLGIDWQEWVEGPFELSETEAEAGPAPSTLASCIMHALGGTTCCSKECFVSGRPAVRLRDFDASIS